MVNLDMVGRLRTGGLALDWWDHLPPGYQRTLSRERVRVRPKATPVANSDRRLFRWAGIPVVTFFTGFHPDYHRPTDTLDRLDVRGLEFRAVAVMACDDEVIPLQERIEQVADDADLEDVYNTERHLLYVSVTRPRDTLLVTGVKPASEFLDDLLESPSGGVN